MVIFGSGNLYSLCSPGNQDSQKIIHLLFFSSKKAIKVRYSKIYNLDIITTNSNKNTIFVLSISTFFDEQKMNNFNPGFLGYKVNISFLTEKLPHYKICGT